jgi:hypothetical protein
MIDNRQRHGGSICDATPRVLTGRLYAMEVGEVIEAAKVAGTGASIIYQHGKVG